MLLVLTSISILYSKKLFNLAKPGFCKSVRLNEIKLFFIAFKFNDFTKSFGYFTAPNFQSKTI